MKIAILVPTFSQFSGIDKVVQEQSTQFVTGGDKVTIFALEAEMSPPVKTNLYVLGMPKTIIGQRIYRLLLPLDFIKAFKWLPKLKQFDIIYSHQYPMNWFAYLAKRVYGVKYVYYNHGIPPPWTFSNFEERVYVKLFSKLANWTIKKADSVISISQYLQKELKRETGMESIVVLNTINTQRFHKEINGLVVRDKLELGKVPIILYLGRISPHKGIHLLIQAFLIVNKEIINARLVIVGKHTFPSYSKKLKQISNNAVIFVGEVTDEDLPYYYAACDIYATATLWEGFDLPVSEAQYCGKPVVAFNIGPHPEILKNSETGVLVAKGDVRGMADAIIKLVHIKYGG